MCDTRREPASGWTRGWSRQRWPAHVAGSIIVGLLLAAAPASLAGEWSYSPFLQIATGYESALLLDPGGAALVVPGGVFLDLAPAFSMQSERGERGFLQLGTRARLERFFNDVNRTLYAQVLWGDYLYRVSDPARLRISLNGNYFNDSAQSALRRFQGGVETGLGHFERTWSVEAFVAGHEVAYPQAESFDEAGRPIDYHETRWSAGLEGSISPLAGLRLQASMTARTTDSVLQDFDSSSVLGDLSLRWTLAPSWRFDAFYGMQQRSFDSRDPGLDEDEYRQWGVGLAHRPGRDVELRVRWAAGRYVDTQGQEEPTDRFELAVDFGPAVFGVEPSSGLVATTSGLPERPTDVDPRGVRFHLHAPGAGSVAIVGDFNGWDPGAHPLQALGDGWWELWIPLPAGSYQYLYLVDGAQKVPPESRVTIDDGFGGRNGLIEVLSGTP